MTGAEMLVRALRDPHWAERLDTGQWTMLVCAARAEVLLGALAYRLAEVRLPAHVAAILDDARADAVRGQTHALWEAEMARRALAPLGVPVVLLKGIAYAAARHSAADGRSIGDLDILVPREALAAVEAALLEAG